MRRNNIRKTEALIMAFALSASLLLTGCGNSTGSKNTASNNASIVSSSNSVDNNNGSSGNQNTNGDSVNENNSTTDEAGINHDYPVMLFSYDKNDTNYEEPEAFNSEHLGGNYGEIEKIEYYSPTTNATRNATFLLFFVTAFLLCRNALSYKAYGLFCTLIMPRSLDKGTLPFYF